jgi:hypothetical protein
VRPTDLTRADVDARSAVYTTTVLRKPKLADIFTRRGKALAGDQWDAVLARAAETEAATPTPAPAVKGRKAKAN